MLHNTTKKSSQNLNPYNMPKINNPKIHSHDTVSVPLLENTNEVINTTANRTRRAALSTPDVNRGASTQGSLLKTMLIGTAVLTGVGALAAGCYYGYMARGRAGAGGRPEPKFLPQPSESINKLPYFASWDKMSMNSQETTAAPQPTSHSPYSYYEGMYGRNRRLSPPAVTIPSTVAVTTPSTVTTTEKLMIKQTIIDISRYLNTTSSHENKRDLFYDAIPKDKYYPLGIVFYKMLEEFCNDEIKNMIKKAYRTEKPAKRCAWLALMVSKIEDAASFDHSAKIIHRNRFPSTELYGQEMQNRRELTTFLLAAECIIEHKNYEFFYPAAMTDHKNYSIEEIIKRERNIMRYFPAHYDDCKKGIDKYVLSTVMSIEPDGSLIIKEPLPPTGVTELTTDKSLTKTSVINISQHLYIRYPHENKRNTFYDTIPKDKYYPLGKELYGELKVFCADYVKLTVEKAYTTAIPAQRCALLARMVLQINSAAYFDARQRAINNEMGISSPEGYAEEILDRRELTTLLLAAECIIEHKDYAFFYSAAMADHKDYSVEEIVKRERDIMSYFPAHYDDCKKGIDECELSTKISIEPDGSLISL